MVEEEYEMREHKSPKDKIIFLDGFYNGGAHLFLYEGKEEEYPIFQSFLEAGIKNNELCVYIFPKEQDKLNLERHFERYVDQFYQFPLIRSRKGGRLEGEHIAELYSKLTKLGGLLNSKGYKALRLGIDFGDMLCSSNLELIDGLKRDSHRLGENFPVSQLCALDINSVDQEIFGKLMEFHDKMFISTGDCSMVNLSQSYPIQPGIPSIGVMSQDAMEQCVKSSLDVIILALLQLEPMCGFDVIKTIVQRFNVLLSQGVVYPLLYSLKEQGHLRVDTKPDHKTRVYEPTEVGRKFIGERLREYAAAQQRILDLTSSAIMLCEVTE